jgi:arylsulfatase A-like enzyme
MSGLEPSTHRVGATGVGDTLPATVHTVQDRFRDAGWRTGSFSGSPLGSSLSGLEQGFGSAYAPRHWGLDRGRHYPSAEQLHTQLVGWLDEQPNEPAFAYVHAMDVHEYDTRRGLVSTVGDYEDAVAAWDAELAKLMDSIDRPLLIAVVSDHGESFWDHRAARHGTGLWASQTHIPWVIHGSGLQGTVTAPVSLADVGPTLLGLAGLPTLNADGENALRRTDPVYSSLIRYTWKPDQPSSVAIASEGWRRIEREDGLRVGFEVATDRCEARPVETDALELPLREWQMSSVEKAEEFTAEHGPVGAGAVLSDDLMRLRALGYID